MALEDFIRLFQNFCSRVFRAGIALKQQGHRLQMSWDMEEKTYTESYHILKFEESEDGMFGPVFTNVLTCKHEV